MIKFIYKISFLSVLAGVLFSACSKKPDVEYTSTVKMSGEWFIEYFLDGSPNAPIVHHSKILTYNTSDPSSNQVWVEDPDVWPFKGKFNVDYNNLLFTSLASTPNLDIAGKTIKVYEGKIISGGGRSKSGNAVDSIYLKVEFSDDAGTIYQIRGHQRTGFFEDEY